MDEEEGKGRINMDKIKILAILPSSQELQGELYKVKLYSSDKEGEDWLYSGLEGFLALIIDNSYKTKYLCLYDPNTYQKCFQYELYKNFEKYFEALAPDFRSFEIDSGFIGLQFSKEEDAVNFERVIKRINSMKEGLFNKASVKENQKLNKEIAGNYAKKLKELLADGDSKYDENYAEDGTHISKHRNFTILNNISYDNQTKKFNFGKISDDLKETFVRFGIKKKDLESDMDFAFTLFKRLIVGLGTENKLKNSAVDNIEHIFPPPDEREKLRKQEEAQEAKINSKKRKAAKKKTYKKPEGKSNFMAGKRKSAIPPPPPPPPPPPSVPSFVPNAVPVPNASDSANKTPASNNPVDLATELKNMKLKKVNLKDANKTNKDAKDVNLGGAGKNFLQDALSKAIKNRRQNLRMHDDDNEDDDDDWD